MDIINRLDRNWQALWGLPRNDREIDRVFQLLVIAYTQPDRHYHNLQHIYHVLTTIDRLIDRLESPISVILAAWFHDVVYDSRSTNNEIESAKFAGELLPAIGVSSETIDRIHQLILATKGHQIEIDDRDLCIFLDADLAILGTDSERYQIYARSIRREYIWVADELYQDRRIRILESFLERQRLYHTDILFDELESRARLNLQLEIRSISAYNKTISVPR